MEAFAAGFIGMIVMFTVVTILAWALHAVASWIWRRVQWIWRRSS